MHVIHRGNNRMAIFQNDEDCRMFLALVARATTHHRVDVHGYVLMTTHVHLLVTPTSACGLARAVKQFAGRYAQYYNVRYKRIGTLWNGRYGALHVDNDRYWLTCLRYIEQNPVRAGMCEKPEDYQWSSYSAHAYGEGAEWLVPHHCYLALGSTQGVRQVAYRAIAHELVSSADIVPPHRN
jgi:putative transposase